MTGSDQQRFHALRPVRCGGIDDLLQIAQQVSATPCVIALVIAEIGGPAIMRQHQFRCVRVFVPAGAIAEAGSDVEGLECLLASFRMAFLDHQIAARADMNPVVLAVHDAS